MKKHLVFGLLSMIVAPSAFASGSAYVNCTADGEKIVAAFNLTENDRSPDDVSGDVSVQDDKGNELANLPASNNNNYGTYVFRNENNNQIPSELKIRFHGKNGSIVNVDARARGTRATNLHGTMTLIVREQGANVRDLRSAPVTCAYDYE